VIGELFVLTIRWHSNHARPHDGVDHLHDHHWPRLGQQGRPGAWW
jgi:hypothetical protein